MRVTRVEAWPVELKLAEPYEIAYERIEAVTNVFIRLHTDGPLQGMGCAAPDAEVTRESPEGVLEAYEGPAAAALVGADPLGFAGLGDRLRGALAGQPSALAGLDMALLDLAGKQAGLPLHSLLGGFREGIETSVTIGILSEAETLERARDRVAQGFRALKLKGGQDVDDDVARVLRVREAVGEGIALILDANQGYDVEGSIRFAEATRSAGLETLEQPTPRDQLAELGEVTRRTDVPVMADESLMTLEDASRIVSGGLADRLNIKLMKVGGVSEAARVDSVARAGALPVMVGCMDESALSIAAALHFCLARPNVVRADLDGHLELIGDPAATAVSLRDGTLYPSPQPGLGFDLP